MQQEQQSEAQQRADPVGHTGGVVEADVVVLRVNGIERPTIVVVRVTVRVVMGVIVRVTMPVIIGVRVIMRVIVRMGRVGNYVEQRAAHHRFKPDPGVIGEGGQEGWLCEVSHHRGERHQRQHDPRDDARPVAEHPPHHETHGDLV